MIKKLFFIFIFTVHAPLWAQNSYQGLVSSHDLLEKTRVEDLIDLKMDIDQAFVELEASERDLQQQKAKLESYGFNASSYLMKIESLLKDLSPQEKESFLNPDLDLKGDSEKVQELKNMILEGSSLTSEFFKKLDNHIQNVLDVSMAYGVFSLKESLLASNNDKDVKEKLAKLDHLKTKYLENKHQYGLGKDTLRTGAFHGFFVNLKKAFEEIEASPKVKSSQKLKLKERMFKIFKVLVKIPKYSKLAFEGLLFIKAALKPGKTTAKKLDLNLRLNRFIKRLSNIKNMPVKVEGASFLPNKYDEKTVNIYAASHRNALFDQFTQSHLGVDNMVLFGAPNNFIPSFLNKILGLKDKIIMALNKNPGFIVVGKGADPQPIEKALSIVHTTKARSFMIFPGGRLPEGLGATMGVRAKFASEEGLIGEFEKAGFKINIIPISMRHNATLFDQATPLSGSDHLSVRVGENINDETRKVLLKTGGTEALYGLLRYALIDDLVTDEKLIWGQVRAREIKNTLDSYTKSQSSVGLSCKALL